MLDYSDKGDIEKKIREYKQRKRRYTEPEIWRAVLHIAAGLAYLHHQKVIHRDIKAANIFVCQGDDGNVYKIGDFNVSKVLANNLAKTQTGTPYYCCPEVWRDQPYDYKSDIYSLGCLLYEMAAQNPPYQAKSLEELFKKVMKNDIPAIPKNYSGVLFQMIKKCMSLDPKARPSAQEIEAVAENQLYGGDLTDRPRAKSLGLSVKFDLLKTLHLSGAQRNQLRSVLPSPRYENDKSEEQSRPRGRDELKLPRLSTDQDSIDKARSDRSTFSKYPYSDHKSR